MPHGVLFQYFESHGPGDGSLWRDLASRAPVLAERGVTAVWFPPAYKGYAGAGDSGYGVYDLYDLGEFDQKGSVRTRYGTRDELLAAVAAVRGAGMHAYLDVVLNHRMGADEPEDVEVVRVNPGDRNQEIGEPFTIRAWCHFIFGGRGGAHSGFQFHARHFNAFGADANHPEVQGEIYRVKSKTFAGDVDLEFGNFDYLLGANVDPYDEEAREELMRWGEWFLSTTQADGVRLDAAKHISASFYEAWLARVRGANADREIFAVAEYWSPSVEALETYLQRVGSGVRLFDVPLHFRFQKAAAEGAAFDLRTIFDGSLLRRAPEIAVTFVDNHDTQPGQSLVSWVDDWFKPLAYALILLRKEGYPCVFYGDYFGNAGTPEGYDKLVSHQMLLDVMLTARARFLHGDQHDTFDEATSIGWVLTGSAAHPGCLAVVLSNGEAGTKRMQTFRPGARLRDLTGHHGDDTITADGEGMATFPFPAGSLSIWCEEDSPG